MIDILKASADGPKRSGLFNERDLGRRSAGAGIRGCDGPRFPVRL